jgi:antirestriction protein ArdC/phage/plasmid primase-like uncharacterized protein
MPLTVTEARRVTWIFIRYYPGASKLAYKFRQNTTELYEHRADEVPSTMKGGYHPRAIEHNGRIYDGQVDVPLDNIADTTDLSITLRHEVLGHYGLNTFIASEKSALLNSLIIAQEEPTLRSYWEDIDRRYPELSIVSKAEEVFALHCEDIQPSHHINSSRIVQYGQQSFLETCIDRTRLMRIDDLHTIACMVAQGLHDRSRTQQTFPQLDKPLRREDKNMPSKKLYHEKVAEKIIESIENGTASFVKPWKPGEFVVPHNPTSGKVYRGINMIHLSCEERADPRWCTYKQAEAQGWQVRKGEKAATIEYWKFEDQVKDLDENNQPKKDDDGKFIYKTVKLDRPRVFYANVFNVDQMENVPELKTPEITWDANERAESILKSSGATIENDQSDRAFYRPSTDKIHLPHQGSFDDAKRYYAVAMHELGHWTGHPSRLDRDLSNPFGSEGYAKEELRAEISSFMVNSEIGLGRDPSSHAGYVESWVKVLKEEPMEIFRASSDASKIKDFVLGLEQEQTLDQNFAKEKSEAFTVGADNDAESGLPKHIAKEKTFLYIPYAEKEAAKQAAGKLDNGSSAIGWDKENRRWHANVGCDLNAVKQWATDHSSAQNVQTGDTPQQEFGKFLADQGLVIEGFPIMDSQLQRVKTLSDSGSQRSGAYTGFLDGHPAGFAQNFKEGTKANWSYKGYHLSKEDRTRQIEESKKQRVEREAQRKADQADVAKRCQQQWKHFKPATDNGYCQTKGIDGEGAKQDEKGRLVIPFYDGYGEITALQRISSNGFKQIEKGSKTSGSYHRIDPAPEKINNPTVLLTEGFSTGKTLSKATGLPVYVCGNSGNMVTVAHHLSKQTKYLQPQSGNMITEEYKLFKDKEVESFIVAGDDDKNNKKNVGKDHANQAAEVLGGSAIFPVFSDANDKGTDFNDLMKSDGFESVKRQVNCAVDMAIEKKEKRMKKIVEHTLVHPTSRKNTR